MGKNEGNRSKSGAVLNLWIENGKDCAGDLIQNGVIDCISSFG